MSESSVRLLRRLAVSMAPVVLAGAGYAARDIGAIERIPYYLEVAFAGHCTVMAKVAKVEGDELSGGYVPSDAAWLFHEGGKGPRADRYLAEKRVSAVKKAPLRAYKVASMTSGDFDVRGPDLHEIDRTGKSDRLFIPQSEMNKSAVVATAEVAPVTPETAPLAVENAPLARGVPAQPDAAPQESAPKELASQETAPKEAALAEPVEIHTASLDSAQLIRGASTALFMMPSLANSSQEVAAVEYSGSVTSANIPATSTPIPRATGQDEWPGLYQQGKLPDAASNQSKAFFGGLTEAEFQAREMRCMALAIYFEARDEPIKGQIAVAQVIMNRVKSPFYPKTMCGVIYQGAERRNSCQFSFACDGHPDRPTEKKEWATSIDIAKQVTYGKVYLADVGDATHYHATYVHPDWIKQVHRVTKIGGHIFYTAPFAPVHLAAGEL
jgi:spore germination cell wall hydrolase CwlJ-like protein